MHNDFNPNHHHLLLLVLVLFSLNPARTSSTGLGSHLPINPYARRHVCVCVIWPASDNMSGLLVGAMCNRRGQSVELATDSHHKTCLPSCQKQIGSVLLEHLGCRVRLVSVGDESHWITPGQYIALFCRVDCVDRINCIHLIRA